MIPNPDTIKSMINALADKSYKMGVEASRIRIEELEWLLAEAEAKIKKMEAK
jgi:hypothetical protein